MSLHPKPIEPVPEETDLVARAAFPKGNIKLSDNLAITAGLQNRT